LHNIVQNAIIKSMRAFILLIFLAIVSGIGYKAYQNFDDKVSPSFLVRCKEWGGKAAVVDKFKLECVKGKIQHNKDIEQGYRYTFYCVAGFFVLLIVIFLFSIQGNKNDD
jgi:hypothetical protein